MKLEKTGRLELTYTEIDEEFPYAEGGQVYGLLTGNLEADGLRGTVHATNLARQRPDGGFTPTLRGILTTHEGEKMFFTMDGISIKDPSAHPARRIVTCGITLWSAHARLRPWTETYLLAELEGRAMGKSWGVAGHLFKCLSEA